ncbi:ryncolin-1-like [Porites lutea]|uniref:ryncolin-1-like n=1 Tax=Porites lutea TaxID=51062 RepID=UPI003CC5BE0C
MNVFLQALLCAFLVKAIANSTVATKSGTDARKPQCNVNNYFYAGPNTKKIEQQLAEIREEIKALKENRTSGGASSGKVYKNCAEVYQFGIKINGVYKINPDGLGEFEVYCDQKTAGGGWTVFQKRQDGSVDFYRPWGDYKRGFGNLNGEFWLGLDKINRLTVSGSYKLRVDLEDVPGKTAFAEYSSFAVTSERTKYQLSLGSYSGTAGDSLGYHRGYPFTTKDRDNDSRGNANCAVQFKGAWWYNDCFVTNLNGLYLHGKVSAQGMVWSKWKNTFSSVKRSEMKIRPKDF